MPLYPLHLNLRGKLCVIVGGGSVAERKVGGLLEAEATVRVVSPQVTSRLAELAAGGQIAIVFTKYALEQLNGAFLAFAATDNSDVNVQVIADAQARGILCNSADAPETADFVTVGTIQRGDLIFSVSTGGCSPALATQIVSDLEAQFGNEYADFVELLGQMRDYVKEAVAVPAARKSVLNALVDDRAELLTLIREGNSAEAQRRAKEIVEGDQTVASDFGGIESSQRTD